MEPSNDADSTMELVHRIEDFFSKPTFTTALAEFFGQHVANIEFKSYEEEQPLRCGSFGQICMTGKSHGSHSAAGCWECHMDTAGSWLLAF